MFEVGKRYEIHMLVGGDEVTSWGIVETYEHPLVKFADTDLTNSPYAPREGSKIIPGEIVNVTSPNFISAVLNNK